MLWRRAEEKIQEAIRNGEFDHLPGFGKPLKLEDHSRIPYELRLAYRVLKNGGYLPPELECYRELLTLETLLQCCDNDTQQQFLQKKRSVRMLQLELWIEQRRQSPIPPQYWTRVKQRLTGSESEQSFIKRKGE